MHAEVLITAELAPHDASRLMRDFEAVGLSIDLRETTQRRSLQDVAWIALAALPLKPFFDKMAEDFAADAYRRLRSLVGAVVGRDRAQPRSPRALLLQDPDSGVRVVLEPDLPDEAYRLLLDVDLSRITVDRCITTAMAGGGAPQSMRWRPDAHPLRSAEAGAGPVPSRQPASAELVARTQPRLDACD